MLSTYLETSPRDVDARLVYGLLLSWDGRYAEARQQLPKVRELAPTLTGQYVEDLWPHMLRHPEQAATLIALTRQVWRE